MNEHLLRSGNSLEFANGDAYTTGDNNQTTGDGHYTYTYDKDFGTTAPGHWDPAR